MKDYGDLGKDIAQGTLPDVSFVKAMAYMNEHPNYGTKISLLDPAQTGKVIPEN